MCVCLHLFMLSLLIHLFVSFVSFSFLAVFLSFSVFNFRIRMNANDCPDDYTVT
jgi:hypothetical protein